MSGALEDHQFLWLRRFLIVAGNFRQSKPGTASIASGDDKEFASAELFRGTAARRSEEDDSVDVARSGLCVGLSDSISTQAPSDCEDGLRTDAMKIGNC